MPPLMELRMNAIPEAIDWITSLLSQENFSDDIRITDYESTAEFQTLQNSSSNCVETPWKFTVCLYLPYNQQTQAKAEELCDRLKPLYRTGLISEIEADLLEEKPASSQGLDSFVHHIGRRFVVLSDDADYFTESKTEIPLRVTNTLAFGSSLHPATIVSLRLLEQFVSPNMEALDLGSGSGILSVAMAKLGANVLALDNDKIAVQATQKNVNYNQVESQVTVRQGSLGCGSDLGHWMGGDTIKDVPTLEPCPMFHLIVANILARVHIALADDFCQSLQQSDQSSDQQTGILITSGFTTDYADEVNTALTEAGFEQIACERQNEWIGFAHCLR